MASSSSSSSSYIPLYIILLTTLFPKPSISSTCTSQTFPSNKIPYKFCNDLPTLNSYLHYTYNPNTSTLSLAFISTPPSPSGWVSYALNPTSTGMSGSQALIAFQDSKTSKFTVKTYNITSYGPVKEGKVWYEVKEVGGEVVDGVFRVYAVLVLPVKGLSEVRHVWQVGSSVTGGIPDKHGFQVGNLNAVGRLDLLSGESGPVITGGGGGGGRVSKRNIHGILNVVSWGIMFPVGIIIARYLKTFPSADPTWFYLHVFCQVSAYAIGVGGWATGLKLGSQSRGITYSGHRNIGISLFALATVQIFALLLRPKKDHKLRLYWNIYHHSFGYTIIILGIINVFKGFAILRPEAKWRNGYIIVISVLGGIALLLEVITWIIVLRRKKSNKSTKPYDGYNNGHGRQEPLAP